MIADIGGGPGRYALWLARIGYRVAHRDLVPLHVKQLEADALAEALPISTAVGDARALDISDESVDAVLLLGPLYHLPKRSERLKALGEAARIVKPGDPVFAAAISRWAPRLHGDVVLQLGDQYATVPDLIERVERTGALSPLFPGSFSGYCHRPAQLRAELRSAGLDVLDLVSLEGLAFALADLDERMSRPQARAAFLEGSCVRARRPRQRMSRPQARAAVLDAARAIERVPELLGIGPHLLATGRRRA